MSPAAAYYQVDRVSRATGITEEMLRALVAAHVTERVFGLLGEPRVNVLELTLLWMRSGTEDFSARSRAMMRLDASIRYPCSPGGHRSGRRPDR
ncbi:MAG: potassium-transporting ATPase subunit C [Candidatus Sulfotelmatobacter sp.]